MHVPLAVRRCRAVLALASVVLRVTLASQLAVAADALRSVLQVIS